MQHFYHWTPTIIQKLFPILVEILHIVSGSTFWRKKNAYAILSPTCSKTIFTPKAHYLRVYSFWFFQTLSCLIPCQLTLSQLGAGKTIKLKACQIGSIKANWWKPSWEWVPLFLSKGYFYAVIPISRIWAHWALDLLTLFLNEKHSWSVPKK